MRGIHSCLKRHHFSRRPTALRNCSSAEKFLCRNISVRGNGLGRDNHDLVRYLHHRFVHGERPSAEYAKLRKESLETQFGHILGSRSRNVSTLYHFGSFFALYRAAIISFHVLKLAVWRIFVHDMKKRSIMFRETLIRLGPFYIKLGQALSTTPDILPTIYCQELSKLQDQIPPFPTNVAIRSIERELGAPVSQIFADISKEPIAAASLGQVYKTHLHSGELVAVKVQRPGMSHLLTLDALLFHMIGGQLKRFAKARRDLFVAVNELMKKENVSTLAYHGDFAEADIIVRVRHMFEEIDYILEGQNADRFASLYGDNIYCDDASSKDSDGANIQHQKRSHIKVPKIYWNLTRQAVLTMGWIDGIKLTDDDSLRKACLNRKELIDRGVYCSLRQLLEVGFFHADPHPGNLVALEDGSLAYLDFGMMGDIPRHFRVGLIRVLVHFVNRDSLGLANDFLSLGFIPEGVDVQAVSDALKASFGDGSRQSRDFQLVLFGSAYLIFGLSIRGYLILEEAYGRALSIMNQLYDVMYDFNFSLPPDYALVIRALGSLEGTAKVLDPEFKVVESAYPFVIGRLLADPNPDMRRILRELLIQNDGSIRWNRLEKLITAISQQASQTSDDSPTLDVSNGDEMGWKSFNMRAVVSATEDLFLFVLSNKGSKIRVLLVKDIIKAADVFLKYELFPDEEPESAGRPNSQENTMLARVVHGVRSFRHATGLAPDVWTAMFIRMALKPEFQEFSFEVCSALFTHYQNKIPDSIWVHLSRLLHKLTNCDGSRIL